MKQLTKMLLMLALVAATNYCNGQTVSYDPVAVNRARKGLDTLASLLSITNAAATYDPLLKTVEADRAAHSYSVTGGTFVNVTGSRLDTIIINTSGALIRSAGVGKTVTLLMLNSSNDSCYITTDYSRSITINGVAGYWWTGSQYRTLSLVHNALSSWIIYNKQP